MERAGDWLIIEINTHISGVTSKFWGPPWTEQHMGRRNAQCYNFFQIERGPTYISYTRPIVSAGARKIVLGPSFSLGGRPCPLLPIPPSTFSLSSPPFPSRPFPPVRSRPPKIQLGGLGERCKLLQWGLGRSPSRQTIWCILTLKSDIWWQQF